VSPSYWFVAVGAVVWMVVVAEVADTVAVVRGGKAVLLNVIPTCAVFLWVGVCCRVLFPSAGNQLPSYGV